MKLDLDKLARPSGTYQDRIRESWCWYLEGVRDLDSALNHVLEKRPRSRSGRRAVVDELGKLHGLFEKRGELHVEMLRFCSRLREARAELEGGEVGGDGAR